MTRSVLNLDLGAGPERPMGGLALMRRPAQQTRFSAPALKAVTA